MANSLTELVEELIREGYLKSPEIIDAFCKIDRADFVLPEFRKEAYENYPLPIGYGQTISQPLTVAFMLELLEPRKGEVILDVGAGSGWQATLLGQIVGDRLSSGKSKRGKVIAIERIPELAEIARANIGKYNFIDKKIVEVVCGDGAAGAPRNFLPARGFDKIIAAATAEKIPCAWKNQLKIGGRIVAPVGCDILKIDKTSENDFKTEKYHGFVFVPLITN